ncbi:hypothetical protein ACU4GD_43760 [Cupriavidus basilensis]
MSDSLLPRLPRPAKTKRSRKPSSPHLGGCCARVSLHGGRQARSLVFLGLIYRAPNIFNPFATRPLMESLPKGGRMIVTDVNTAIRSSCP